MFLHRWRRFLVILVGLTVVAVAASGCGLFGGDDEPEPQVVDPPPAAAAQTDSEPPAATVATGAEQQQQAQPAEAVAVTTTSGDQEQEQAAEPASVQTEAVDEEPETYVVQAGDTLAGIANSLGVRIDDLITLNGIQDPDVLHVGQVLLIPRDEPTTSAATGREGGGDAASDSSSDDGEETVETPAVELPNVAVPSATPTLTSAQQFPQPDIDVTLDAIPDPPSNFLQYGAAALPWLHGETTIDAIIELFKAWPMPALAVGNDRVYLIDTDADQIFSVAVVYTNPNSFGAAVPFSNLVVYDPVPGRADRYRIAYDHALAYGREVQGIEQLGDADMTGDDVRDISFREMSCNETGCVSSFYVLSAEGDGYRVYTGPDAIVADVTWAVLEDRSGDGAADLVVEGLATDEVEPKRYVFTFVAEDGELREALRVEASE